MSINQLVPIVVEKEPGGYERSYDIYSRLLKDYIVFITGPIDMALANTFIAQMLFLESSNPERDISVYINTPGGEVTSGLAIFDTMQHVKNDVSTINVGLAASMGAVLLCGGTKEKRFVLPESKTMIHQVLGGMEGQASDLEIYAREALRDKERLTQIISERTGQSVDKVTKDIDRNFWMNAKETVDYGIADKVMEPRKSNK